MGGSALVVACVVLLAAQSAIGADPDELARRIKFGSQVFVIDWTGAERTGTVVGISRAGMTIDQKNGPRLTVPIESIARVQRTDSVWNGFLIGAAFVPTLYGIGKIVDAANVSWTPAHTVLTWFYAVVGAWCDWLREGRADLYRADRRPAVSIAPLAGARAVGVNVQVRFGRRPRGVHESRMSGRAAAP